MLTESKGLLMLRLVALYTSKPFVVYLLYTVLILSWVFTTAFLVQAQVFFAGMPNTRVVSLRVAIDLI